MVSLLVGITLEWQGFLQEAEIDQQPESALTAIRILIGPAPTLVLLVGMVLAIYYPITRQIHATMLKELEQKHKSTQQPTLID